MNFSPEMINLILQGIKETLYMTVVSTAFAYLLGIPLGTILYVTDEKGIFRMPLLNRILGIIINILRSVPFIILLITILPFTKWLVGTTLGSTATIVPLVISAAPFVARMVESSLKEVDAGVIKAARSMGSSPLQIIFKVLIPEAKPSLLVGAAITITTILGYSAMAGFVAGGGLGAIAISYGYNRYQEDVMLVTVILLVLIVQGFQELGMYIARKTDKRIND